MKEKPRWVERFLELLLFSLIAIFSYRPVENYDFWFHAKYGEHILQTKSLPFTDVFSHTAYGQPAIPYEWLFQVGLHLIHQTFGFAGVSLFIVILALIYLWLFRQILSELFHLSLVPRIILTAGLFVIGYDFWVERPQALAYTLFMATLYLLLKYIYQSNKTNTLPSPILKFRISSFGFRASSFYPLLLTLPIFFLWTNSHASMILGLYLFFSLGALYLFRSLIVRFQGKRGDKTDWRIARDLLIFGSINTIVTILPPLGTKVYELLKLFFEKREFIATTIDEWVPLPKLAIRFHLYIVIIAMAVISFIYASWRNRKHIANLLPFLSLIPLGLFVISGVRHTAFTMPAIFLLFVPAIREVRVKISSLASLVFSIATIASTAILLHLYRKEAVGIVHDYPEKAIPFIKTHLQGNMFNEFHIGGYLLYHLGPEIKTYIDGRTDMFLPSVLPENVEFAKTMTQGNEAFKKEFDRLVQKYTISWAVLTTNRLSLSTKIANTLDEHPDWHLIYFDDTARIYIRDDHVNENAIKQFQMTGATPFRKMLYRKDLRTQAKKEYQEMFARSPSAAALNALGFMDLEDDNYKEAEKKFRRALEINPRAAPPKMNLGELAAKDGNFQQAIRLYRQAIVDDPERGLAYLRLGQLIVASGKPLTETKEVWQKGLMVTADEEIRQKLEQELKQLAR